MKDLARVPLMPLERWGTGLLLSSLLLLGIYVEIRSAYLSRRMGDLPLRQDSRNQ